jgi:hypothetical protein
MRVSLISRSASPLAPYVKALLEAHGHDVTPLLSDKHDAVVCLVRSPLDAYISRPAVFILDLDADVSAAVTPLAADSPWFLPVAPAALSEARRRLGIKSLPHSIDPTPYFFSLASLSRPEKPLPIGRWQEWLVYSAEPIDGNTFRLPGRDWPVRVVAPSAESLPRRARLTPQSPVIELHVWRTIAPWYWGHVAPPHPLPGFFRPAIAYAAALRLPLAFADFDEATCFHSYAALSVDHAENMSARGLHDLALAQHDVVQMMTADSFERDAATLDQVLSRMVR